MVCNKIKETTKIESLDVDGEHVTDDKVKAQTMNDFLGDTDGSLGYKFHTKEAPSVTIS